MAFNTVDIDWEYLLERLEHFLDLGEEYMTRRLVEYVPDPQIFEQHLVFRWVRHYAGGYVEKVTHPHLQDHATLLGIEDVIDTLCENTAQFVHGLPANHILLRGESGGGKRTAILGLLKKFDNKGLRLIEIHGEDLHQLAIVIESLRNLPFYFVLFCRDLFPVTDPACHRELSNLLQGGIELRPRNILLYAIDTISGGTAPRRAHDSGFPGKPDASPSPLGESTALESGFGILMQLPPMKKSTYLDICRRLAGEQTLPLTAEELDSRALAWAQHRGKYSGLTAGQFIDDLSGKLFLGQQLTGKTS